MPSIHKKLILFFSLSFLGAIAGALFLSSPNALANINDANMAERVKSFSYYSIFNSECTLHKNIKGVDNYDWFDSRLLNADSVQTPVGTLGCKQGKTNWIKDATQIWGFSSDAGDTLCDLGYRQQRADQQSSRSKCGANAPITDEIAFTIDRNGERAIREAVMPKIRAKYYNGNNPSWTPEMNYHASLSQLLDSNICGATTSKGDTNKSFTVSVVNADRQIEEKEYFIENDRLTKRAVLYDVGTSTEPHLADNCEKLAQTLADGRYANAYVAYLANHPDEQPLGTSRDTSADGESGAQQSNCRIDGIGWLLCPVVRFIAKATDKAYVAIEDMLTVRSSMFDQKSGTYEVWKSMRNFANIGFVIVFLIIIYSHLTSMGISNYNIKKMLPRLIAASILVNVSFWVCAIAVDVSNILGHSLKAMLDSYSNNLTMPASVADSGGEGLWDNLALIAIGATYVGGVAFSVFNIAALLPLLVLVAFTVFMVAAILTLRQALIVILIIVSPIAFVLYLLPNTESWFKKWLSAFRGLLLIFPVIAVIFGGAAIAGQTVMDAAGGYKGDLESGNGEFLLQVMGAAITIAPLLMIGTIFNAIMSIGGGTFGKFGAMLNNPNKGPFDKMRRGAENLRDRRANSLNRKTFGKGYNPRGAALRYNARRNAIDANNKRELERAGTGYVADQASEGGRFLDKLSGGDKSAEQRALGSALATRDKLFAEEVTAATAVIKHLELSDLSNLATGGSATGGDNKSYNANSDLAMQSAAQKLLFDASDQPGIERVLNEAASWNLEGDSKEARLNRERLSNLADVAASSSGRPAYLGMGKIGGMRQGKAAGTIDELKRAALKSNAYGEEGMLKADADELNAMAKFVEDNRESLGEDIVREFSENARKILREPRLASALNKRRDPVVKISQLAPETASVVESSTPASDIPGPVPTSMPTGFQTSATNVSQQTTTARQSIRSVQDGVEQILTVDHNTPRPNASQPGATPTSPKYVPPVQDIKSMTKNEVNMIVQSAGGPSNLTDIDIARIIQATHGRSGFEDIHNQMRSERAFRQGGDGMYGNVTAPDQKTQQPPQAPPPPNNGP